MMQSNDILMKNTLTMPNFRGYSMRNRAAQGYRRRNSPKNGERLSPIALICSEI